MDDILAYLSSNGVRACKGLGLPETFCFRSFFTNIDAEPRLDRGVRRAGWFIIRSKVMKYWLWMPLILYSTSCRSSSFLSEASWMSLCVWLMWFDKTFIYCRKSESDRSFSVNWYWLNAAVLFKRFTSRGYWVTAGRSPFSKLSLLNLPVFF